MSNVILCDIGNSFLHFYYSGRIWREKPNEISAKKPHIPIYYISVNLNYEKKLLDSHKKCINLEPYVDINTSYTGLGIDRKVACKAISNGIIIDAGSAITIDIVENNVHLGGYILPGISSYQDFYRQISYALDVNLDLSVNLYMPPKNTKEAVSFGILKSILLMIKHTSQTKKLYFTGGDGKFFAKFFENSIFDNTLVFKGMQQTLKEIEKQHN
ncbi:pantothenate kinase [Helicobacter didelphidarum]|uniref:Type III pantothenate kinase n=1 Tax=Helicobacter didelphidarum TaxID=2040648 RepID=A0A3D8IJ13_9HELI|nr:type III pantothenate kinase [Helicobacter didelphidarum]RDU64935.1 pantothenate kinase [Helicobacter didelphidarum]